VKIKLKRMKGCRAHQLPSYLDEFMWCERQGTTHHDTVPDTINTVCKKTAHSSTIPEVYKKGGAHLGFPEDCC